MYIATIVIPAYFNKVKYYSRVHGYRKALSMKTYRFPRGWQATREKYIHMYNLTQNVKQNHREDSKLKTI